MHDAKDAGWTGMAEISLDDAELDDLYDSGEAFVPAAAEMPPHTGLVLLSSRGSALGRVTPDKQAQQGQQQSQQPTPQQNDQQSKLPQSDASSPVAPLDTGGMTSADLQARIDHFSQAAS